MNKKIMWIYVARFLGIFSIYIGHIVSGASYYFVFLFHVPLFFLISGCMENYNKEKRIIPYILRKFKNIFIPFIIFSIISIIFYVIENNCSFHELKHLVGVLLRGNIRGTFIASSLWFLSCLFVMQLLFFIIKKIRVKPFIFIISFLLYIIASCLIKPSALINPSFIFNFDSALYYIIYYAIGYLSFPYIKELFTLDSKRKECFFIISGFISFMLTVTFYFKNDFSYLITNKIISCVYNILSPIVIALVISWFVFIIARVFEENHFMINIGKNTLYLCGGEYLVKRILINIMNLLNINFVISSPLAGIIYAFVLLIITNKYIVPIIKEIVKHFQNLFDKVCNNE